MKSICSIAIVVGSLLFGSIAANGQINPNAIVRSLQSPNLNERYAAVQQVLEIPPSERTEMLWVAVANELERMQNLSHSRTDDLVNGRPVPEVGEEFSKHIIELVRVLSDWHEVRALPPLISAAGTGTAIPAILAFGETAVEPLVIAARTGHYSERSMVVLTLAFMLEGRPADNPGGFVTPVPLSAAARMQILQVARELIRPGAAGPGAITATVQLALATGDRELRQQVESLVFSPTLLSESTGITDSAKLLQVQNAIRTALDQHKQ